MKLFLSAEILLFSFLLWPFFEISDALYWALKPKNNKALRKIEGSPAYYLYEKIKIF